MTDTITFLTPFAGAPISAGYGSPLADYELSDVESVFSAREHASWAQAIGWIVTTGMLRERHDVRKLAKMRHDFERLSAEHRSFPQGDPVRAFEMATGRKTQTTTLRRAA